jgi:hypothetical protein
MKNEKMATVFGRLRHDWLRRRGDFIRPREVPAEVWRSWPGWKKDRYLAEQTGVSVP